MMHSDVTHLNNCITIYLARGSEITPKRGEVSSQQEATNDYSLKRDLFLAMWPARADPGILIGGIQTWIQKPPNVFDNIVQIVHEYFETNKFWIRHVKWKIANARVARTLVLDVVKKKRKKKTRSDMGGQGGGDAPLNPRLNKRTPLNEMNTMFILVNCLLDIAFI